MYKLHNKTKIMATSTITALTKNLVVYSNDGNQYLHIEQSDGDANKLNFLVKNASDSSNNDTIKPYFRNLVFRQTSNVDVDLASKIGGMSGNITTNTNNIAANTAAIASNLAALSANSTAISTEAGARAAADASLQSQIDAANSAVGGSVSTLTSDLTTEQNARIAADSVLQTAIDDEVANRIAAISAEETTRVNADSALSASITTIAGDIATLQTNMSQILNLAPTTLDSFAEVATQFDNLNMASILARLDALEAAVSALQGN
jgi:hypothetical protein